MFYTTLNCIHQCGPCCEGWEQLLKHLGKTKADDEPLPLSIILEANGLDDAVWSLRTIDNCPEIRLFAVRCVRQVQHLLTDSRSLDALDVAERFAVGEATREELDNAREAASDAAGAEEAGATEAAWDAVATDAAEAAWWVVRETRAARSATQEAQRKDFIDIFCSPDL